MFLTNVRFAISVIFSLEIHLKLCFKKCVAYIDVDYSQTGMVSYTAADELQK